MLYYNPTNTWLTEHCLICGSINHIFLHSDDCYAWECWNCHNRWWIDDLAEDAYLIEHNLSEELDLMAETKCQVKLAYGHYERIQ